MDKVASSPTMPPPEDRYFEDYVAGAVYEYGSLSVDKAELIAFGERYDPQAMHINEAWSATGPFGGLIASGWQTCALAMRLYVDGYVTRVASLASPGIDGLRWIKPVRPGDTLSIRVTVLETVRSRSKPDRGMVRALVEVFNQDGDMVMTLQPMSLMGARPRADDVRPA